MTTPQDSSHSPVPSVREIAALTARLRELSALGRDADPAERAAFLADKDALIARITATAANSADVVDVTGETNARTSETLGEAGEWWAQARSADPAVPVVTYDRSDYYSDADIATIGDALAAGDADRAAQLQDRPWTEQDSDADPAVTGRVDARVLIEGDRFAHDGTVHVVDDVPIAHDEVLTVPTRAGDDAPWVELPAGQWVTLNGPLGPSRTEETLTHADAARRLTERGFDPASAQAMVAEYLHDTSRAVGAPVYLWSLDQTDVDAIAADHQWVDHQRGETLAHARERAGEYAAGWAARATVVHGDRSPGYASHAEQQAGRWAERARVPEPFTHPDATDAAGNPDELAERITTLHDRVADRESDHEVRREQLAHWHHDDHEPVDDQADSADNGQMWVGDDGPGLP